MTRGRAALAALAGIAALGATAGAFVSTRAAHAEAAQAGAQARERASGVLTASLQALEREAATAAAIPELAAAIKNKVDAATFEDLFQSEDWWAPFRTRVVTIVGPGGGPSGMVIKRGVVGELATADLLERATSGPASGVVRIGDVDYLVGSAAIPVPMQTGWTLLLARPIDAAVLADWSGRADVGLMLSNGRTPGLSARAPEDVSTLIGHEGEPAPGPGGAWAAAALPVSQGLWLWATRPLESGALGRKLWGLAALLGVLALALAATGRRGQAAAPSASAGASPPSEDAAPLAPRPSANRLATQIASNEGRVFGRYTVLEKLGEGGMCDVFTAALTGPEGFQRVFALKRLKPEIARNRSAVDQFIDEAKLGSVLVHSNIVPVFDFGKVGDGYFIAQEYIVGRNIGQLLARHVERLGEPLDLATIFYIAFETLQALGYAHDKTSEDGDPLNVVHRDVSPGNVIVSRLGEVKLIDFGITKSEDRVSKTDMGNVKGNASFMAPEQARGQPVDRRADLFSLGLVMFGAMANEPFYGGGTTAEVFYNAGMGPTNEHLDRIDRLPAAAATVLRQALANDPADRFATAEDFAAALAPHVPADGKASLARLMAALFGDELRRPGGGAGGNTRGSNVRAASGRT